MRPECESRLLAQAYFSLILTVIGACAVVALLWFIISNAIDLLGRFL